MMNIYAIFTFIVLLCAQTDIALASGSKRDGAKKNAASSIKKRRTTTASSTASEVVELSSDEDDDKAKTTSLADQIKANLRIYIGDNRCNSRQVEQFQHMWHELTAAEQDSLRTCEGSFFAVTITEFLAYQKPAASSSSSPAVTDEAILRLLRTVDTRKVTVKQSAHFAAIWGALLPKEQEAFIAAHEEQIVLIAQLQSMIPPDAPVIGTYVPVPPAPESLAPRPLTRGIENPHVMCFMNATLQGILASPRQVGYLSNLMRPQVLKHAAATDQTKIPLLAAFFDYKDTYFFTAGHAVVTKSSPAYANFAYAVHTLLDPAALRQHDPHEFYTRLFTILNQHGQHVPPAARLLPTRIETENICSRNNHRRVKREDSYVVMLTGLNTYADQVAPITITDLITKYETPVVRAEQIECSSCGCENDGCLYKFADQCPCKQAPLAKVHKKSHDTMKYTLHPANHLVLYVQRANADGSKCKKPVIAEKTITVDGKNFELMSVLFHGGKRAGVGHWTTMRQEIMFNPTPGIYSYTNTHDWIYCNDSRLFNTPDDFPVTVEATRLVPKPGQPEATMFFYEGVA